MEIVLVASGLPVGPNVLKEKSLGGSETALICVAKELRALDHMVTVFANLAPGVTNGSICESGVRWVSLDQYQMFASCTETDAIIGSRDPNFFGFPNQSKCNILWCHDLATHAFIPHLMANAWNIDEIWTVSEYHRQQYHKVSGYPLDHIWPTRNGVLDVGATLDVPRSSTQLLYAARPERGLVNLVRPGGIMEKLPEFELKVCFYDNWPDHLRGYYQSLFDMCNKLPNVEILGSKTQLELRQLMKSSAAYVYPTQFEEVSCIIAREAIEQGLPFITTNVGALPETLGDCGHIIPWEQKSVGSDHFCRSFADEVKAFLQSSQLVDQNTRNSAARDDLYWDGVVKSWIGKIKPKFSKPYSVCKSLVMDGDVFAAYAYAKEFNQTYWLDHIKQYYKFITGEVTMVEHYKGIYELEESKNVEERKEIRSLSATPRYQSIAKAVNHDDINLVLEYGCAEGPIIFQLAKDFPGKQFVGIDIAADNITLCRKLASDAGIGNVSFHYGDTENWPEEVAEVFDAALIGEVLEHTIEPWAVAQRVEQQVRLGGKVVISVPSGAWEWNGLVNNPAQWAWRAHIWHINKKMLREMLFDKQCEFMEYLPHAAANDGRSVGNIVAAYFADHKPIARIDVLQKALDSRPRQTLAACMIVMNDEADVLKCLKSIAPYIDQLNVAIGPSTDHTREYIQNFMANKPYIDFKFIDVPKIESGEVGFDDVRNMSIQNVDCDWILWIDSDEYLSGHTLKQYIRNNSFDSYALHQHHFTCEPRGAPAQLDKPARLFRNNGTFRFYGKVHEHAEKGYNGGPGSVFMLPDIDIGHTGYVNENIRRERFARNFPLLEWDRAVNPDRKIGLFLWMRDLFHQMQYYAQRGDHMKARNFAQEAIHFFKEYKDQFIHIGSGFQASLNYYSEANRFLGQGHDVKVKLDMEGMTAEYEGRFMNSQEAFDIAIKAVNEQMEKRDGGYWQ